VTCLRSGGCRLALPGCWAPRIVRHWPRGAEADVPDGESPGERMALACFFRVPPGGRPALLRRPHCTRLIGFVLRGSVCVRSLTGQAAWGLRLVPACFLRCSYIADWTQGRQVLLVS